MGPDALLLGRLGGLVGGLGLLGHGGEAAIGAGIAPLGTACRSPVRASRVDQRVRVARVAFVA
eukprot:4547272-Lingulodinium_polyedra.AAC.1